MPDKKSDKPQESAEEKELEHRVDLMMSTELLETKAAAPAVKKADAKKPTSKAAKDQKTAPKLPKSLKIDEAPEPEVPDPPPSEATPEAELPTVTPEESQAEPDKPQDQPQADDPLEDSDTDQAVDDIVAHESDTILAVDDARTAREQRLALPAETSSGHGRHKWLWVIGLVIVLGTAIDLFIFLSG